MKLIRRCAMSREFSSESWWEVELAAAAGATSRRSTRSRMLAISSFSGSTLCAIERRVSAMIEDFSSIKSVLVAIWDICDAIASR
eukprot:15450404-Alexandrium_andersonii.AAC.1